MEIKVLIIATLFSLIAALYHVADRRLARRDEALSARKA